MKQLNRVAIALAAAVLATAAGAQEIQNWRNSSGEVWKNSVGECWRSNFWTPATAAPGCDGAIAAPAPAPAPAPAAKPALGIDSLHPQGQRIALGAVHRRVFALDFQHQRLAIGQADDEVGHEALALDHQATNNQVFSQAGEIVRAHLQAGFRCGLRPPRQQRTVGNAGAVGRQEA